MTPPTPPRCADAGTALRRRTSPTWSSPCPPPRLPLRPAPAVAARHSLSQSDGPFRGHRQPAPPLQAHRERPLPGHHPHPPPGPEITSQWLSSGWRPPSPNAGSVGTTRLTAAIPGPEAVLADVVTHPEMSAVARLLISSQRTPGFQTQEIADRLGFPYPGRPHPLDPLQNHLSRLRAKGSSPARRESLPGAPRWRPGHRPGSASP